MHTPPPTPSIAMAPGSDERGRADALRDAEDAMQFALHHLQASSIVLDSILVGLSTGDIGSDELRAGFDLLISETYATRRRTHIAMLQLGTSAERAEPV